MTGLRLRIFHETPIYPMGQMPLDTWKKRSLIPLKSSRMPHQKRLGIVTWRWLQISLLFFSQPAVAKKTNQAVYEESFDLAGGGASLTRATQEGMLFANPAQLTYGGQFHRWIGLKTNVIAGTDSIEFAQQVKDGGSSDASTILESAYEHPLHVGMSSALSWLTQNVGICAFARAEPDISAKKYGESGLPEVRFQAEAYGGALASFAVQTLRWLSLGVTAKYLYVGEPDVAIGIAEQQRIQSLSSAEGLKEEASYGKGVGADIGALIFLQGNVADLRIAGKVDDVGGTEFDGSQAPFKQTVSAGLGLTFHSNADAIHLSADYRDILGAYGESIYKRLYAGAKVMIRTYVGVAAGLYQGYPTYGAVIDLIFVRIAATVYGREYGSHPDLGVERRNLYVLSFAMGF